LTNTDGDPVALTTLTYGLTVAVAQAFDRLKPLAIVHGEDHMDEVTRDASGALTTASLSWVKAGNRQHKGWDNTVRLCPLRRRPRGRRPWRHGRARRGGCGGLK